jgi:hypothetical protein
MKKNFLLILILLPTVFFSCTKSKKEVVVKVKLLEMSEDKIYDKQLAYDVIFDLEELNSDSLKKESRKLFLKGVDAFKNKKNPTKAVELFKASIVVYPDAKTYYELGNALSSVNHVRDLEEALNAYNVAEHLDFQPISKINYNIAAINYQLFSLSNDQAEESNFYWQSISNLRSAIYNGFSDTSEIRKDRRLASIINTSGYKSMVTEIAAEKLKDNSNGLFALYINSYPIANQPYEIPVTSVDMKNHTESISYDFSEFIPEMENTSFGREVSHDYFYVAKIEDNPQYKAVIYSSVSFFEESMQPVRTNLVTYDPNGKIISRKMFACQCSAEKVKKGKIEDGLIIIEDYSRTWAKPIDEVSFEENSVKDYKLIATAKYKIDDSGHIIDFEVPKNYSDSVFFSYNN